jgi:RNA recognition motif-containing protein
MKLIILNFPRDLNEDALGKIFEVYGKITACNLVLDEKTGASKGFGFVEMENGDEATIAVEALNGSKLNKNKLRVKVRD